MKGPQSNLHHPRVVIMMMMMYGWILFSLRVDASSSWQNHQNMAATGVYHPSSGWYDGQPQPNPHQQQQQQQQQHQQQQYQPELSDGRGQDNGSEEQSLPPLPEGWSEHYDPSSGQPYYYNAIDGTSTWERPMPTVTPPSTTPPVEGPDMEANSNYYPEGGTNVATAETGVDLDSPNDLSEEVTTGGPEEKKDSSLIRDQSGGGYLSNNEPATGETMEDHDRESWQETSGAWSTDQQQPIPDETGRHYWETAKNESQIMTGHHSPYGDEHGVETTSHPPAMQREGLPPQSSMYMGAPQNQQQQQRTPEPAIERMPYQPTDEATGRWGPPSPSVVRGNPPGQEGITSVGRTGYPDARMQYQQQLSQQQPQMVQSDHRIPDPRNSMRDGPPGHTDTPRMPQPTGWVQPGDRQDPRRAMSFSGNTNQPTNMMKSDSRGSPTRVPLVRQQPHTQDDTPKESVEIMAPWETQPLPQDSKGPERKPTNPYYPPTQSIPHQSSASQQQGRNLESNAPPGRQPMPLDRNAPGATAYGLSRYPNQQGRPESPPQGQTATQLPDSTADAQRQLGPQRREQIPYASQTQAMQQQGQQRYAPPSQQQGQYKQYAPLRQGTPYGNQYSQYSQYGAYQQGYSQQPNPSTNQLVAKDTDATSAVKEALGSAWQGLLGFGSKTREVVDQAKNTVLTTTQRASQTITATSTNLLTQAKSTLGSVFEGGDDEATNEYSLSGRYGTQPASGTGGSLGSLARQDSRPMQQGYPYQQGGSYQQPSGAVPSSSAASPPPYGQYPPGYGPPRPRNDPPYPHQMQPNPRQGQQPIQSQWPSGQYPYPTQPGYDPHRNGPQAAIGRSSQIPGQQIPPEQQQLQHKQQQLQQGPRQPPTRQFGRPSPGAPYRGPGNPQQRPPDGRVQPSGAQPENPWAHPGLDHGF